MTSSLMSMPTGEARAIVARFIKAIEDVTGRMRSPEGRAPRRCSAELIRRARLLDAKLAAKNVGAA
jgi:hypothetical protein